MYKLQNATNQRRISSALLIPFQLVGFREVGIIRLCRQSSGIQRQLSETLSNLSKCIMITDDDLSGDDGIVYL